MKSFVKATAKADETTRENAELIEALEKSEANYRTAQILTQN